MSGNSSSPDRNPWPRIATWLALLLPVFAWAPLTFPGYFVLHSGFLPAFNLNHLMTHLTDPAWAPLIGQAHDVWRSERALPYLLAAVPRLLGLPATGAVKLVFGLSLTAGAVGVYAWARRSLGAWAGLLAAFVYVLWPINLATVYVRGAFAEAVFLGLMPWVLWAAARAAGAGGAGRAALLALLMAATFWTQAGLAAWLSIICLIYLVLEARRAETAPWAGLAGWAGGWLVGLAGLAPVILRNGWGSAPRVAFAEHFVYPHQLLLAGWGFGPSIPGPDDTLTYQLGIVAFGLALFALVDPALGRVRTENARHQQRGPLILFSVAVLMCVFLSSTLAAPLWRIFSLPARTLTYPWQLLLLGGPWAAMLAGLGGSALAQVWARAAGQTDVARAEAALPLYAGLLALTLIGSYSYLAPQTTLVKPPDAPVAIFGEDEIALLSAGIRGGPGPGHRLVLHTEWQALRPIAEDYTIFFHAMGPDGTLWGQADSMPQGGAAPTSGWQPGQVVDDQLRLTLKPDTPAESGFTYPVGLYLWQTGARLPAGSDDKVVVQP